MTSEASVGGAGGAGSASAAGAVGRTAGGSADVDLGEVRQAQDAPRSTIGSVESAGRVDQGVVEGKVRSEAGGDLPSTDVKAQADAKISGAKPEELSRAESKGREVESTAERVRNPNVRAEVEGRVQIDDDARNLQSQGGEVRGIASDPTAAATQRATAGGEAEIRGRVPDGANEAKGQVDSAASTARDPKSAVESKVRGEVDAEVRVDVNAKIDPDPTKK